MHLKNPSKSSFKSSWLKKENALLFKLELGHSKYDQFNRRITCGNSRCDLEFKIQNRVNELKK